MEQQLREHLTEGEQLLWSGRPEAFDTMDRTNKAEIIAGLVIKVLVTLGILALCFISAREQGKVSPLFIAIVLAFAAFLLANPFLIAGRLRKKTIYGLTDSRVLRCGVHDESVPYARIKSAVLRTDADGHTSLLCGPRAVNLRSRQWRGEADASFIDAHDDPEAARVILYALPMDDALKALLDKYIPVE